MPDPTDSTEILTVMAAMRAKSGKEDELRRVLAAMIAPTRGDQGMVTYELYRGASDPALFCFYENWRTEADLEAHLGAPHLAELGRRSAELIDGPIVINRVRKIGAASAAPADS